MNICRLCRKEAELRESHFIPKFAFRWLKDTGSPYFRQVVAPNLRHQDGPKRKLLCQECETRFSKREVYFANKIFYPVVSGEKAPFEYDERLAYFVISVLWRDLVDSIHKPGTIETEQIDLFRVVEREWRTFLLDEQPLEKYNQIHLFITDFLTSGVQPVKNFNVYMARNVDATPMHGREFAGAYVKFARFLLFAVLTPYDESKWVNTRINFGSGVLTQPQGLHDPRIGEFLVSRARISNEMYKENLSSKQQQLISEYQDKNLDRLIKTDLGKALTADFLNEVMPVMGTEKVGRNEKCPCGSGIKYKYCHGSAT